MRLKKLTPALLTMFLVLTLTGLSAYAAEGVAKAAPSKPLLTGKININSASVEQLEMMPRIGNKTALAIIEYRSQHGPFKKVEDITQVKGIGEKMLEELRDFIVLEGETTLKKQ